MKTRLVIIAILLLVLTVLLTRNDERITDRLLNIINPIKQNYRNLTQGIKDKSHSYIFQKESIEKLSRENRILRKHLLEQTHYIQQVKNIYNVLPQLSKLPIHNISITETISYVKLNSFSQIILTKPKKLTKEKLYGLIQDKVVAGTAKVRNNQLYGYLTSDNKCRFSVFIGTQKAPGIAIGAQTNKMIIKFIPKWHKLKEGDKVTTSGLDDIFFAGIPVGIVTKIEIQSSYKVAHIKTYNDIYHPKTFFLINDAKATLAKGFDSNTTRLYPYKVATLINEQNQSCDLNQSNNLKQASSLKQKQNTEIISSIPSRIDQTQEEIITPETPIEKVLLPKNEEVKKKNQKKKVIRSKPEPSSLDLF